MQIAQIKGGAIVVDDYRKLFPQTSFPASGPSPEFLAETSCIPVCVWLAHDQATQRLGNSAPYILEGTVYTTMVVDLTQAELDALRDDKASEMRQHRDQLLTECDWTQLPDSPVDKSAWAAYRIALREVTGQDGFPLLVLWPNAPAL